jgi:hypothetical protein
MHHFAGGNTGTLRSRRAQPQQNHNFEHMSESEDEGDSDDEVLPQRGGGAGGGLRQGSNAQAGAAAAAPLDDAAVVADIKHAVMESLRLSSRREKELMDEVRREERQRGILSIDPLFFFPPLGRPLDSHFQKNLDKKSRPTARSRTASSSWARPSSSQAP